LSVQNSLSTGFLGLVANVGKPVIFRYFDKTIGSVWDDEVVLTVNGSVATSGIAMPLSNQQGSTDSVLIEQGKLQDNDLKLYVNGSVSITGSEDMLKVIIGGDSYSPIPIGTYTPEVENTKIYKRIYLRRLTTGSYYGE